METREFEVRSVNEEERTVSGFAVTYGETIDVGGYRERFQRGAFTDVKDAKLFYGHSDPIGRITRSEDTEHGFLIEARISATARGDEVYTLLRDNVLNKFSVGFTPIQSRNEDGVVVRESVRLHEVSVVANPAYQSASVLNVREEDTSHSPNDENTQERSENEVENENKEVTELRSVVEDLERRVAVMGTESHNSLPVYRSIGEFVKGVAGGDEQAIALHRDFANTGDSVVQNQWVGDLTKIVDQGRPVANAFTKQTLGNEGNFVEFAKLASTSGAVAKQSAEGGALPYLEVVVDTDTAAVGTYGGYSSLSRQAIERSSVNYLNTVFEYQAVSYSKATETAVRTVLGGAAYTGAALPTTAAGWRELVLRQHAGMIAATGYGVDRLIVDLDTFVDLTNLEEGSANDKFLSYDNGSLDVLGMGGTILGRVRVVVDPSAEAGTVFIGNSQALRVWESAGTPARLQAESVINLTKDFALYGYLASDIVVPGAIKRVGVDPNA